MAGRAAAVAAPTASEYFKYVSIDATTTRASTVIKSIPTRDTRTHASMTIPLSRTRSRTSIRLVPPAARSTAIVTAPYWFLLRTSSGSPRQRREPAFHHPQLLAQLQVLLHHLLASRRQMTVVLPPIETDLLCLVDRTNHQPDADRQQLDFGQRDLDVAGHDQTLVQHAVKHIDKPGVASAGP